MGSDGDPGNSEMSKTEWMGVKTEVYNWGYISLAVTEERSERQAHHVQRR